MAYLTVTTPVDVVAPGDGQLSLREAIEPGQWLQRPGHDPVRRRRSRAQTPVLTGGELTITQDLRSMASAQVTIDGNTNGRILQHFGRRHGSRPEKSYLGQRPLSTKSAAAEQF